MNIVIAGTGPAARVHEALDEVQRCHTITRLACRDADNPAVTWARRHSIPVVEYIPECLLDLGVILPTGDSSVEHRHARLLMDGIPCLEIHV